MAERAMRKQRINELLQEQVQKKTVRAVYSYDLVMLLE